MSNALELKNLTKHYTGFTLDNLSLTLPEGCVMGLIGENGAGKSTTIKALLGLVRSDSGEIQVLGEPISDVSTQMREHLGVVLDECTFPENLSLLQIGKMMQYCYQSWQPQRFSHYTKLFSLPEKKPVKAFSRGMKMKLSIAVALSHDSRLLILDEATSGLDPLVRDEILDVFLEFMQDEHHSILISSHILSDLEKICDYIACIHGGKLVFCEEKDKLLEQYQMIKCTKAQLEKIDPRQIVGVREHAFGIEALAKKCVVPADILAEPATIEEIMVYTIKEAKR